MPLIEEGNDEPKGEAPILEQPKPKEKLALCFDDGEQSEEQGIIQYPISSATQMHEPTNHS